ncbi:MAG: VanZ family protein [Candidatus Binataceae bacterium]
MINRPAAQKPSLFRRALNSRGGAKWIRPLLLIAVMSSIYFLGTSLFSAARMRLLIDPSLSAFLHLEPGSQLLYFDYLIRWTAHYLEYFVVFLLLLWTLRLRPRTALILAVALAAIDEGHQYFIPDRTCSLFDLKLDAAGAATAFILASGFRFLRGASRLPSPLSVSVVQTGRSTGAGGTASKSST